MKLYDWGVLCTQVVLVVLEPTFRLPRARRRDDGNFLVIPGIQVIVVNRHRTSGLRDFSPLLSWSARFG